MNTQDLPQTLENPDAGANDPQIKFTLPEGYVIVKEEELRGLERKLEKAYTPTTKRGITKKQHNEIKAKIRRKMAKASQKKNRK